MKGTIGRPDGDLDAVAKSLRNLPHDAPPEGLALEIRRAVAQVPLPRRPLWRRMWASLDTPAVLWGYRMATLVLLVGILAGVWNLVAVRRSGSPAGGPTVPGPALAARVGDPTTVQNARVTFVFYAPEARSVAVVGSFNDWDAGRYPMTKGADGNWTVKVDLRPGQYEYQFVVDGSSFVPDPNATEQRDDGLGGANAVLRL